MKKFVTIFLVMTYCIVITPQQDYKVQLNTLYLNGIPFNLALNQIPEYLNYNDNLIINGRVIDQFNNPIAFVDVGIEDGLKLQSIAITTNSLGEFSYQTYVNSENIKGPRNLLFFTPNSTVYTHLNFSINIPQNNNLFSNAYFTTILPDLNSTYSFEIAAITTTDQNGIPHWIDKNYVSSLYTIHSADDVTEENYVYILQQYQLTQTNPYFNNPGILAKAKQIDYARRKAVIRQILGDHPGKIIAYVGSGGLCASTLLGNPIGPEQCAEVISLAAEDLLEWFATSILEWSGAPQYWIDAVKDAGTAVGVLHPSWTVGAYFIDEAIMQYYQETNIDIIEKGYQGYLTGSDPFQNYSFTEIDDAIYIEFENNGELFTVGIKPNVINQNITVSKPISNEQWTTSTPGIIEWSSQNLTGNVNIKLSIDGGSTFPMTLISNTPNDGNQQITVPNLPSTNCRIKVESSSNANIFGLNPGIFSISQPPQNSLYAGSVAPQSGSTLDNFNFVVTYKSSSNLPPDNVQLIINQIPENMTAIGSNWQQGVQFTKSLNNFTTGTHEYYFSASVNGQELRYPNTGNLNFTVTQSVAGWDLAVDPTGSYLRPSNIGRGTTINVNCDITNYSNPGNTYSNVPLKVELRSATGALLDQNTKNIPSITPNESQLHTLDLNCPSDAADGNYSVIITIFPNVDSNPTNNSLTLTFHIGSISNELYISPTSEIQKSSGQQFNVVCDQSNTSFTLEGVSFGDYPNATFRDPSGSTKQIYEGHLRSYSSYGCAIAVQYVGSDLVSFRTACATETGGPSFQNKVIIGYPGQKDIFFDVVEAPSTKLFSTNSDDYEEIFSTTKYTDVISWFDKVVTYNNGNSVRIYFDIPSNATPDVYKFYQPTAYQGTSAYVHLTRVEIHIVPKPPSITSLSTYSFSADDQITITGTNFGSSGSCTVKFNDLVATQTSNWTTTSFKVIVPVDVQSGNVFVTNSNGPSNGIAYTVKSSTGAPIVAAPIPDQSIYQEETKLIALLNNVFSEPNNQVLIFSATSSNQNVIVNQNLLTTGQLSLTALANATGNSTITVTATDPNNKTATDVFAVSIVNTPSNSLLLYAKIFLEGPYNGAGAMATTINIDGLIPLNSNLAYSTSTYGYQESTVGIIPNSNIVDWVLVELRSGTGAATKVAARAGFIKNDGTIVDIDGVSPLAFNVSDGNYYIVVRHRNHLAIMSSAPQSFSSGSVTSYDFTTAQNKAYGSEAMIDLGGSVYGMWMGDVNSDGVVKYNLDSNDRLLIYNRIGNAGFNTTVSGYFNEDVNLDGTVKYNLTNNDRLLIYNVIGNSGFNTTRSSQVPN